METPSKSRILILEGDARQTLPFLKSLKQLQHQVTIACRNKISPGYFSRYPDRRLIFPSCQECPQNFLEAVLKELKIGCYDVVLPFGPYAVRICIENQKLLEQYVSVPVPSYTSFMKTYDKAQTMAFCMENDIPCPLTYFPEQEPIESIIDQATFPLWMKPGIGTGAIGQSRLDGPDDLRQKYPLYRKNFGPMIIQEYIPHDRELVCHTFWDNNFNACACVVLSKPRFFPPSGGTNSILVSVHRPDIVDLCIKLFKGLGISGIADADFIIDPRDGQAKLLEINPRVSCGIKIGFAGGVDFADMWVRLAKGLPVKPQMEYKKNLHLRNLCQEILWYLYSNRQARKAADPPYFNFFGKNVFYQTIAADDPLTFLGFVLHMLRKYSSLKVWKEKLGNVDTASEI